MSNLLLSVKDKKASFTRQAVHMICRIGKVITMFLIGGIVIHALIMFLDYYLIPTPLYINLRNDFIGSIFSAPMIPMISAYGISLILIYFLWIRSKKALLLAHRRNVQKEKISLYLKSIQRITGILAENVSTHNAEIMNWVQSKQLKGQQVSKKVEKSTQKIAKAMHSLSEISFVFPYTDNNLNDLGDVEEIFRRKLEETTGSQKEKSEIQIVR